MDEIGYGGATNWKACKFCHGVGCQSCLWLGGYHVWRLWPTGQKGEKMFHTVDEDFDHFLSYSGMRNEPQDTLRKLYIAFKAAWDPCHSAQHCVEPTGATGAAPKSE